MNSNCLKENGFGVESFDRSACLYQMALDVVDHYAEDGSGSEAKPTGKGGGYAKLGQIDLACLAK